jgi:hypothetical protein
LIAQSSGDRFNVWKLGFSPIKLHELEEFLKLYPNKTAAYELLDGFSNGFQIKYRQLHLKQPFLKL